MRPRFFCIFSALCLSSGGTAGAETLSEALATAYESNPTPQARRARLRATDEALPEARGGYRRAILLYLSNIMMNKRTIIG